MSGRCSIKSCSCDSVARLFAHLHFYASVPVTAVWGNMLRGWRCVYLPHFHDRCLSSSLRKIIHVWHKLRDWLLSAGQCHLYTFWDQTEMSACCTLTDFFLHHSVVMNLCGVRSENYHLKADGLTNDPSWTRSAWRISAAPDDTQHCWGWDLCLSPPLSSYFASYSIKLLINLVWELLGFCSARQSSTKDCCVVWKCDVNGKAICDWSCRQQPKQVETLLKVVQS